MGKKNSNQISKNNRSTKPLRNSLKTNSKVQRLKVTRRNPKAKRDFKSKPKTIKHSKIQSKAITKKKGTKIETEEEHIDLLENDNKLFQDSGYYYVRKDEELVDEKDEDWNKEESEEKLVNLHDLLTGKMNELDDSELDPRAIENFRELGKILNQWTSGKLPKLFHVLPALEQWRDYIVFTRPQNWTPHAMFEAVSLFTSNLNNTLIEIFYKEFLVPYIRLNIKRHSKLNVYLYNGLKKALFKTAGFFKGIIFPLAETLTAKEANIIGSILKKCSIPSAHSASAIMKLFDLNGLERISHGHFFFIKLLLSKKYALPTPVKAGIINFLVKFVEHNSNRSQLPVIFHQVLLIFAQTYKFDLTEEERKNVKSICTKFNHPIISPLVIKEVDYKK